jgi:NADPH2:quinone reductase
VLDLAEVRGGDVVLIPSAAGGLGSLFVQAARRAGAYVVGLAGGPAKVALGRTAGRGRRGRLPRSGLVGAGDRRRR